MSDTAEQIWNYLTEKGLTSCGAAGLMGNLQAESGMLPNRVEILCLKRLAEAGKTYTDTTYTAAVDSGKISRAEFLNPLQSRQYGYGLAQWTSPSRKEGLYNLAKARGVSIADLETQLDWLMTELSSTYKKVLAVLRTAQSVKEASDYVLCNFEQPADCSVAIKTYRAKLGQKFHDQFSRKGEVDAVTTTEKVIKVAEGEVGYLEKASNADLDSKTGNAGSANYTKYWRDLYPAFQGQAWCAIFVAWCFVQAFGMEMAKKLLRHWPYTYCPTLANLTANTVPKVGSVVLLYRNGTYVHTGLVVAVTNTTITTIEGNTSGASGIIANGGGVCKKTYAISSLSDNTKYFMPDYSLVGENQTKDGSQKEVKEDACMFDVGIVQQGSNGNDVKLLQTLLKAAGCKGADKKALTLDGECGNNTVTAIRKYQKKKRLTVDGIAGPQTWSQILLR